MYVVCTHKNHIIEAILISTLNVSLQLNLNDSNTNDSFTVVNLNSFLSS